MRDFAKGFYHSPAWKHCQAEYVKRAGGLCERCLAKGLIVPGVIVHHKIHLTPEVIDDPSITLNPDNLELLCRKCHGFVHRPEKRYSVGELGRITAIE